MRTFLRIYTGIHAPNETTARQRSRDAVEHIRSILTGEYAEVPDVTRLPYSVKDDVFRCFINVKIDPAYIHMPESRRILSLKVARNLQDSFDEFGNCVIWFHLPEISPGFVIPSESPY
jgi:hypothetical protein